MKKHLYELQSTNNMNTDQEQSTPKRTKFSQGTKLADDSNPYPHQATNYHPQQAPNQGFYNQPN